MFNLLISAPQLQEALGTSRWLIFDVRHDLGDHQAGYRAYEQGHVPGAQYLDNERQLAAPKTGRNGRHPLPALTEFAALMRVQGLTPTRQVVVYDSGSGAFAARLWWMLRWLGHEKVAVLDGGWPAWLDAGGEVETQVNKGAVTEAQALQALAYRTAPAMPTVDAASLLANLDDPILTVLDARSAERFSGKTEPMDPVAGHIPGALNRPSSLNIGPDGRFKPAEALRAEFEAVLGDVPAGKIVHQCGSGITACHNLFAMELAGMKGSMLYPGSWSEWCSDPGRPVVTGN